MRCAKDMLQCLESMCNLDGASKPVNARPRCLDESWRPDMRMASLQPLVAALLAFGMTFTSGCIHRPPERSSTIEYIRLDDELTLRHMVVRNPNPAGTVLFLHGFPETLYAWKDISPALGARYEVHAFDWPGYGLSSRPPADRF